MSKDLKVLTLEVEYMVFMIAIVLVRTVVTTYRKTWTAFDLATYLNNLNISRHGSYDHVAGINNTASQNCFREIIDMDG
jgi:hypothetical protein